MWAGGESNAWGDLRREWSSPVRVASAIPGRSDEGVKGDADSGGLDSPLHFLYASLKRCHILLELLYAPFQELAPVLLI